MEQLFAGGVKSIFWGDISRFYFMPFSYNALKKTFFFIPMLACPHRFRTAARSGHAMIFSIVSSMRHRIPAVPCLNRCAASSVSKKAPQRTFFPETRCIAALQRNKQRLCSLFRQP